MPTPGPFISDRLYDIAEQCGPGRLFGSRTGRDNAVKRGDLNPGLLVSNRRANFGEELNQLVLLLRSRGNKVLPEGFGGKQVGAGRKRKQPDHPEAA